MSVKAMLVKGAHTNIASQSPQETAPVHSQTRILLFEPPALSLPKYGLGHCSVFRLLEKFQRSQLIALSAAPPYLVPGVTRPLPHPSFSQHPAPPSLPPTLPIGLEGAATRTAASRGKYDREPFIHLLSLQ
jgi:hypothetical protein